MKKNPLLIISSLLIWSIVCAWIMFLLSGCSRSQDDPGAATASIPNPQPPILSPVCTTGLFATSGGIGGLGTLDVLMPNFDATKGDTVNFSYKRFDAANWSIYRPGFFSPVTFTVAGSTVAIHNTTTIQYDWALAATIKTCK